MSFNLKLFFTFVIFGIFLALFSVYTFSNVVYERQFEDKLQQSNMMISEKEKKLSEYMKNLNQHLLSAVKNKIFIGYTKDGSNKEYVEELFSTIIYAGHGILQIKYTDNNQKHNIHNNKNLKQEMPLIINKYIEEEYFFKLQTRQKEEIWYSPFGFNLEKGVDKNTIKPIFIVGINLGSGVLQFYVSMDEISNILSDTYSKLLLVDKNGNILIDSQNKLSWSEYFHKDVQLKTLLDEENYYFLKFDSLNKQTYTFLKLEENNEEDLALILIYSDFGTMIDKEMYNVYLSILFSTIVLAVILAFIFSQPVSRMANKIERLNNRLDKKVEQRTAQLKESLRIIDKYVIRSVTDTDGMILRVSDAFCEISQYSREELIGQKHSLIRHPDMPDSLFENMWTTIKSGKTWDGKIKNLAKDGSYYWVSSHIEPNFVNNKIVSYTAIRTKISNKVKLEELNRSLEKRIEEEVKKSTEQLEQIQQEQLKSVKLSSIGSLAAGMTHEINTPLTYIKGNFELMKYDIEDLPESDLKNNILADTAIITDGLNRISNIVEAMKEVSQKSSEVVENVNIYNTLFTALTLSFNNSKQVSKIYINGELFDITNDKNKFEFNALVQKQRIEQLWIIIINNALDELVKIENYETRSLNIEITKENNTIIVDFLDNAGGIKEDIIQKIFEPFISNKERGGMGIGLNIAKKIVDEHGGKISASNHLDGAKFRIELYAEGAKC